MSTVKNTFVGLCIAVTLLLVSSTTVQAQVVAGSGDVAGYVGYFHMKLPTNSAIYGATGGYNVTPYITGLGEYGYAPVSSGIHVQIYGGGARFNLMPNKKLVPYGIFTGGGNRIAGGGGGDNGYYISVGGGASCYLSKNWGVRPEFRYLRNDFTEGGSSISLNDLVVTGGVFYQWGGKGKKK